MVVTAMIMKTAAPKFGKPGDIIPVSITSKQASDWLADYAYNDSFEYRVIENGKQIQKQEVVLENNIETTSTIKILMPASDLTIKLELWYTGALFWWEIKKVDETLITIATGNTTTPPEEENETKTNPWDKLFSGIDKTVITILVILIVALIFYHFIMQRKGK